MSGNPTGSNVVPMPHAATPPPAQPSMPMPFPMWGGGGSLPWGPGCCPPGGMDALLKCYCDVQAATAFICSVMVQCIQTNPAVTAAIIAAIEASGSTLPLLGVTNGTDAQPGQVGEWVMFTQTAVITGAAGAITNTVMGTLNPGDWDVWATGYPTVQTNNLQMNLNPQPAGFTSNLYCGFFAATGADQGTQIFSPVGRALTTVPSLIALTVETNAAGAGTAGSITLEFMARRRR